MVKAKLISTQGILLEAVIDIGEQVLCVMDAFSEETTRAPKVGEVFDVEFLNFINENESWETIFSGNLEMKVGIDQLSGWTYMAFGKIISVNPVKIDCGLFIEEDVLFSHDPKLIGEYVAFTIRRLGVSLLSTLP